MRKNTFLTGCNAFRSTIMAVLLFTLFTTASFTAFASGQGSTQSSQLSKNALFSGGAPSGNVDLQWNPQTKVLTATLHVSGLASGSSYAAHIHTGTCETRGGILYPFNEVITDATGNGTSTTTINNVTGGIPASGWNITVHSGPTAETSSMLCGNVVNQTGAVSVSVPLNMVDPTH
jgi:hypothetical protein